MVAARRKIEDNVKRFRFFRCICIYLIVVSRGFQAHTVTDMYIHAFYLNITEYFVVLALGLKLIIDLEIAKSVS